MMQIMDDEEAAEVIAELVVGKLAQGLARLPAELRESLANLGHPCFISVRVQIYTAPDTGPFYLEAFTREGGIELVISNKLGARVWAMTLL